MPPSFSLLLNSSVRQSRSEPPASDCKETQGADQLPDNLGCLVVQASTSRPGFDPRFRLVAFSCPVKRVINKKNPSGYPVRRLALRGKP